MARGCSIYLLYIYVFLVFKCIWKAISSEQNNTNGNLDAVFEIKILQTELRKFLLIRL